eukprot:3372893-Lingulodinium_polyedra.AAC.1
MACTIVKLSQRNANASALETGLLRCRTTAENSRGRWPGGGELGYVEHGLPEARRAKHHAGGFH